MVRAFAPNVIVTDLMMPVMDGLEMVDQLRAEGILPPTIVLTAFGSVELAVNTVHKHGVFWFLEKPLDSGALRALLDRAAEQGRLATENERLHRELMQRGVLGELVGQSGPMQAVFRMVRQVAPTSASVLITGESGTGKELTARAIHAHSPRATQPFLAINCAAMPETLMESEIFGHEKGAFTGATDRHPGALELAHGGTLLLDEIGEMPMQMQAKLLRVLEDLRYRRLGGKQEMTADVRVIAATNRQPAEAIREGRLREDLYYRLNVFRIDLPTLRERAEDIPLIAAAMVEKLNEKHGTRVTHIDPEAVNTLRAGSWNGNVRELRNTIERAVILAREGPLLKPHLNMGKLMPSRAAAAAPGLAIEVGTTVAEGERMLIEATLRNMKNNKTQAAKVLGISTKTLHAKLKQYRIEGERPDGQSSAEVA
jgi:DNA-binding NtrC family response regulator